MSMKDAEDRAIMRCGTLPCEDASRGVPRFGTHVHRAACVNSRGGSCPDVCTVCPLTISPTMEVMTYVEARDT